MGSAAKKLTSSTVRYYGRIPVQDCKEDDFLIEWIQIPADADVIENFYQHRSEFTQLAEMMRADQQIQYISESQFTPCESLEFERFSRYKNLYKKIEKD